MDALTVGYGRVSTASGEQQSALRVQLARLEAEHCDLILHDVESGLNPQRAQYQQLRRLVESGRVAQVIATAISRLGRDATESDAFVRLCDQQGVVCRSLDEGVLSMATPEDLLLTRLRGSLSEGESMKIRQRVNAGLRAGRALRKPMRKPCWGYRLRQDRLALEPDPIEFARAQHFLRVLRSNGWRMIPTLRDNPGIAPFSSCTGVRAWMLNPTIRGGIAYGQLVNHRFTEVHWDRHPALLTHAEFTEFERVLELNRRRWGHNSTTIPRLLTGLCVCSECQRRMTYVAGRVHPALKCRAERCSQYYRSTREDLIVPFVLEALAAGAAEKLAAAVEHRESAEARELRRQIAQLQAMADPELAAVIEAKAAKLESVLRQPGLDLGLVQRLSDPRWFDQASPEQLRTIFEQTVAEVTIATQAPVAIRLTL